MTKRLKTALGIVLGAILLVCAALCVQLWSFSAGAETDGARDVLHDTVAVHDPSVVLAYEDEDGNTFPEAGEGRKKVYFVFGTQVAQAKSYDLVNWTSFTNNLNIASNTLAILAHEANYARVGGAPLNEGNIIENLWAPDVIWNEAMGKWCMYLSVNGENQYSSIAMLTADDLNGAWSYGGTVVYSRITADNVADTDYQKATGSSSVPEKYSVYRNSYANLIYGVNAIDPAVTIDENGDMWMSYGSWFGGIYMLKLDKHTGLRDYSYTYENDVTDENGDKMEESEFTQANYNNLGSFTVHEDKYLGIHIAGGHHSSGEGSYLLNIGDWWYLFLSYGGYAPEGGYNMRVFRSEKVYGPYTDAAGNAAVLSGYVNNTEGSAGMRVMSGYTWSWWEHSYIAQGHNSAFVDDDGSAYLVYHNKYTDGTVFHVMKVHRLLVNEDGWLVTAPFEALASDGVALGLTAEEIAGEYGVLYMKSNSGSYNSVCKEEKYTLAANGTVSGAHTGTWEYDGATGAFTIRTDIDNRYHNGYLLRQTLEGTNIQTLSFTAVNTSGSNISQYTYWGYRYPSEEVAAEYALSTLSIPQKAQLALFGDISFESKYWHDITVSVTKTASGFDVSVNGENTSHAVVASEQYAEYDAVGAGQAFLAMPGLNGGVSVSFDYTGYASDWTAVLSGSYNGAPFEVNLSTLEYDGVSIFESHGTAGNYGAFASAVHEAFYTEGTARATVAFHADGSVQFFRDGVLVLTYDAGAAFKDSSLTVSALNGAVRGALKEGTLSSAYAMSNVVLAATESSGMDIELPAGVEEVMTVAGNASGISVGAVADASQKGVAVSFMLSEAIPDLGTNPNNDWKAMAIVAGGLHITMPNLEKFDGDTFIANCTPAHTENGGAWNSFLNNVCYVTVSVSSSGVDFYKNGLRVVYYEATDSMGSSTVGSFASELLTAVEESGFTFAGAVIQAKDLIVTDALTTEEAQSVYAAYQAYAGEEQLPELDIDLPAGVEKVMTVAGSASGISVGAVADASQKGVAVSFALTGTFSDKWASNTIEYAGIKITLACLDTYTSTSSFPANTNCEVNEAGAFANFTGFVTISVNTDGTVVFYKNGSAAATYTAEIPFWEDPSKPAIDGEHTVSEFVNVTLAVMEESGFAFGNGIQAKDLIVTDALTEKEARSVYAAYQAIGAWDCAKDGHKYQETARTGDACTGFTVTYTCSECTDSYTAADLTGVVGHKYSCVHTDSTCAQAGSDVYTCSVCEDTFTVEYPRLAHEFGGWKVTKSPTANETGVLTGTCENCTATKQEILPVLNDEDYAVSEVPASCESDGSKTYTYTFAGTEYTAATVKVSALGHDYVWSVGKAPTATQTGTIKGVCSRCQGETERSLPVLNEEDYRVETQSATCTAEGSSKYYYTIDEEELLAATVDLPKAAHDYGDWQHDGEGHWKECSVCFGKTDEGAHGGGTATCHEKAVCTVCGAEYGEADPENHAGGTEIRNAVAATEEADGYTGDTYCLGCGEIIAKGETIGKLDHTHEMTYTEAQPATCTQEGHIAYYTCSKCGNRYKDEAGGTKPLTDEEIAEPALGHDYVWSGGKEPTADETGILQGVCSRCEAEDEKILPALNEKDYRVETQSATCTAEGSSKYYYTIDEEELLAATVDLPKAEHEFAAWKVTKEPTAEETGALTGACKNCTATKQETLPVLSDTAYEVASVAATCSQSGYATYTYTFEGIKYTAATVTLPALGHDYVWSVGKAPTKTQTGALTGVCSRCEGQKSETLPVLNGEDYALTLVAATCENAGSETYVYTFEGKQYTAAVVTLPALGHTFGDWQTTKAPTYTQAGEEERECSVCGDTEVRPVAALGLAAKFREEAVEAKDAQGRTAQFAAIKAALTTYAQLSAAEKQEVAEEYAALEALIGAYNASAEEVNEEMSGAAEIAFAVLASAAAAGALAAAWFALKKFI